MNDQYECFKQEIIPIWREHAGDILEACEKLKDELREAIALGVALSQR